MIEIRNLSKQFNVQNNTVYALNDINLTINDGDIYSIIGMSGAGKSTLVRCINMLERPTNGTVLIDGVDVASLNAKQLRLARRNMSMIFQGFNLLMQRNCLDNICFPLELAGVKRKAAKQRAAELLETVGLPDKATAYPAQLSGGQQQRVAIARALATNPRVLLCDEATSALDPNTTHSILSLISEINRKMGITVIIITHQMSVVEEICNRVAILDNGSVVEEGLVTEVFSHPKSDAARRLVYPDGNNAQVTAAEGEKLLRLVFNGAEVASTPLMARMAIEEGLTPNIKYASLHSIGDKTYGSMLLGLPDDIDTIVRTVKYLSKCDNVIVEEVRH